LKRCDDTIAGRPGNLEVFVNSCSAAFCVIQWRNPTKNPRKLLFWIDYWNHSNLLLTIMDPTNPEVGTPVLSEKDRADLDKALTKAGLRSTRQRESIYAIVAGRRDHPTADEVFHSAREAMPTISLATVYNCLETLTGCGLLRQVNFERAPSRFCPNRVEHAHFYDRTSGRVYDVPMPPAAVKMLHNLLPEGFRAETFELSFQGDRNPDN
jgi:Fur family peroxide stress response transcriptional regulator